MEANKKMSCEEAVQQIKLADFSAVENEEVLKQALTHVEGCPNCQAQIDQEWDAFMRQQMGNLEVPPLLGSKIVRQLDRTPAAQAIPNSSWRWAYALGGAAVVILALILYTQFKLMSRLGNLSVPPVLTPAAVANLPASHSAILNLIANCSAKRHKTIINSQFVVFENDCTSDKFRQQFTYQISLPNFSKDLKLVGGNKCHSCSYEVAYLLYRTGAKGVSLCMFSPAELGLSDWAGKPVVFEKSGYNIAIWRNSNLVYSMVFEMPVKEARTLVRDLYQ